MASFLDVSMSSDSEDDVDYVPPVGALSDSSGEDVDNSEDNDLAGTNQKPRARKGKSKTETVSSALVVDTKKHAEDVWKSFLSDVEQRAPVMKSSNAKSDVFTAVMKSNNTKTDDSQSGIERKKSEETESNTTSAESENVSSVYESCEFAGGKFTVSNPSVLECNNCLPHEAETSTSSSVSESNPDASNPKKRGISSVLGIILNENKKLTTLQKSLYDWKTFKQSEGIEEDLVKYNKGKGGFIERQRFLQRSDMRSFELEKSTRLLKKRM